jgi:hypothetical protein
LTTSTNHPWAKYYASRGVSRLPLAELKRPAGVEPVARTRKPVTPKPAALSSDLAAALAAVNAAAEVAGVTAAPFISVMQKQAVAREVKRIRRLRVAMWVGIAAVVCGLLHVAVTQVFYRIPAPPEVQTHAEQLKADLLPLYSTARQPLQVDTVKVSKPERIAGGRMRYVAEVTLRLRKPLYVPAASNGTAAYRQLQVSLQAARDQELRYNLFAEADAPEVPDLPMLLQTSHRAGDAIVVKVPFEARRFGWRWKLEAAQTGRRVANRGFDGNALEFFGDAQYLIYSPQSLGEVRQRTKAAREYVTAVTKEVQRQAGGRAVAEAIPDIALAEATSDTAVEHAPAINPDAPAIELPAEASAPARAAYSAPPVARR